VTAEGYASFVDARWTGLPGRRRRFRAARWALWAVAGALAPALLVASVAIPDHAEEFVIAEARSASQLAARATEAAWAAELASAEPFGLPTAITVAPRPGETPVTVPGAPDEARALKARVEAAALARGPEPVARLAEVVERKGPDAAAALVALARVVSRREGPDLAAFLRALDSVPFDVEIEGNSARALALIIAAEALGDESWERQLRQLEDAVLDGRIHLTDRARLRPGPTLSYTPDPTWAAIADAIGARIGHWRVAPRLNARARRLRAFGHEILANPTHVSEEWTPFEVEGAQGLLLARSVDSDEIQLIEVATERVGGRIAASLEESDPTWRWQPELLEPNEAPGVHALAATAPLVGTTRRATLHPRNLDSQIHAVKMAALEFRLAGAVAAIALAVAALAVLRTLRSTEDLLRLRSTFVASVSHDLRTPVASIGLLAGNLRAGHVPEGRRAQYADAIEREAARLGRLVDDLLDFGRVERGLPARVQRERVALRPWLEGFTASESAKCAARGRALGATIGDLPLAADLDRHALERAISNLVDNALAHSGSERIELRASAEGDALRIDVLDEGAGTRETRLDALFEPFARGADAGDDRSAAAGTGLGLAIVRAIAEAHGGTATLERRADASGMRARVEVPLGPAEDAA